jgi:anti-sigma factor RsiW
MNCDLNPNTRTDTLSAWLDGELPPDQLPALQQHIADCPSCTAELAELIALRRSLLAARKRFQPSEAFRQKMQLQLAASNPKPEPKPQPKPTLLRLLPIPLALAAMLLLTAGWVLHTSRSSAFTSVADLHVNALASSNPLDVVSTDRHTVKPWFQGRIPFSFNLPELAGTDFTLLGGRLVYLHQQPGAQLIFSQKKHEISVLIFQNSSLLTETAGVEHRNSFNLDAWHSQNLSFFIIGDTEPAEIGKLTTLLKQTNP